MPLTKIDDRGLNTPIDLLDNERIRMGTDNDFEIYHNAANSVISHEPTGAAGGALFIQSNNMIIRSRSSTSILTSIYGQSTDIYHIGQKRFQTTIDGINVINTSGSGATKLRVTANEAQNAELHLVADEGDDNIDNWKISSNGSSNTLNFENWNGSAWEKSLTLTPNGSTILHHNNVEKLRTTTQGTDITGGLLVDTVAPVADVGNVNNYTYGYFNTGTQQGLTVRGDEAAIEILASDASHHAGSFVIRGGNEGFGFVNSASNDRLEIVSFTASGDGFALHNVGGNLSRRDVCMMIQKDGAVALYHDNSKKFETTSSGVKGYGTGIGSIFLGDFRVKTEADGNFVTFKPGESLVRWHDNHKAVFGASNDLQLYHDGTHSYLYNTTGELKNRAAIWKVVNAANSEIQIKATENAAVELYYDNNKKFETTSTGAEVTGGGGTAILEVIHQNGTQGIGIDYNTIRTLGSNTDQPIKLLPRGTHVSESAVRLYFNDSEKFRTASDGVRVVGILNLDSHIKMGDGDTIHLGTGNDFRIYHDGTTNYLRTENGGVHIIKSNTENIAKFIPDGAVELYHDNSKKFETTSYGTRTTGYHTQSSNVGFQGDAADWTSSTPYMHNMSLQWNSGHLVNSTGVFTCPVAGKYLCSATVQAHRANNPSGSSGQYFNVIWQKNNSNYHLESVGTVATDASALSTSAVNGKHGTVTATVIIDCAANDTIRAHSNHGYRHNTQNICSVYLLG